MYAISDELRHAADLLSTGHYMEAATAHRTIFETQPEHAAMAANNIGVALFFLRDFKEAIQWYEEASRHGFDRGMTADNIQEAKEAMVAPYTPHVGDVILTEHGKLVEFTAAGTWTALEPPAEQSKNTICLGLLFPNAPSLPPAAVTQSLRSYHPTMVSGTYEVDITASSGAMIAHFKWGNHSVQLMGFGAPMPSPVVEMCIGGAHFKQELKEQARAHRAHALLVYEGLATNPLDQYVALTAVTGVLAYYGAIVVLNEAGHTSLPTAVLTGGQGDTMEHLYSLPIPILYSGFVKFDVEGIEGVWMRTFGNHLLGLPDFSYLAAGHHEGERAFDMFCDLMAYIMSSGSVFAPGHTMEIGSGLNMRMRQPQQNEYFLDSEGEMLVLERV